MSTARIVRRAEGERGRNRAVQAGVWSSLICAAFRADAPKSANVCKFQHAQGAKKEDIVGYRGIPWDTGVKWRAKRRGFREEVCCKDRSEVRALTDPVEGISYLA